MIEESKYCNEVMEKHFNNEIVMNKEDKDSNQCWVCDNAYIDNDVKVRDHFHITGKYRRSAHKDCNMNLKVNHKTSDIFHNLKNYNPHLIMQKLGKFNSKINVIPDGI